MIFLYVGYFLIIIGVMFQLFPSKNINRLYGYRSPLAEKNIELWKYAQKISGNLFVLMGIIMAIVGNILKYYGWTNYFIIEMLVLVFPIMPIFIITEQKLAAFEKKQ